MKQFHLKAESRPHRGRERQGNQHTVLQAGHAEGKKTAEIPAQKANQFGRVGGADIAKQDQPRGMGLTKQRASDYERLARHESIVTDYIDRQLEKGETPTHARKGVDMGLFKKKEKPTEAPKHLISKDPQEASKVLEAETAAFEKGYPIYEKGEEYRKGKEYEKALEQYDLARKCGYATPALYRGFVMVYKQMKDYDKALFYIDEAIQQDKVHHFNSAAFDALVAEREKIIAKMSK